MDLGLQGKVAVVTGGSVGIGLAVAHALAREGVQLVLCARDEARVMEKAREIEAAHGVKAVGIAADVADARAVQRVLDGVEAAFGGADILINNAGTGSNETIADAPDEKWQYYWDLHTMAAVRL
jgi:3-oxoacyl-[acyl-carrier protein] reductase